MNSGEEVVIVIASVSALMMLVTVIALVASRSEEGQGLRRRLRGKETRK